MTYTPGKKSAPSAKKAAVNPKTAAEACELMTKMVHKQAYKWTRNHRSEYDDIFSEGMYGVLKAFDRFDGSDFQKKGYSFTSYAWMWVRAEMKAYAEKNWKRLNHLVDGDISESFDRPEYGYELNENKIDLERRIEKLPVEDQAIFQMRKEGYTFKQIAEETNAKNQFKVRDRFLEIMG